MRENNETVNKIVALEWEMFDAVNRGKARAECQENYPAFHAMRSAQFLAWPANAAESYLEDLTRTSLAGRNLISEKYIHMMKTTRPSEYDVLLATIPQPSEAVTALASELTEVLLGQTRALFEEFPRVAGAGRPLYAAADNAYTTSVETYQYCELLTYSERTLTALKEYVASREGETLAYRILENTVSFYGYTSIGAAEAAAVKQ